MPTNEAAPTPAPSMPANEDTPNPETPAPKVRRTRKSKSKYAKTHPRYWLSIYQRNYRHGLPRYQGIPAGMHEAVRMVIRASSAKQRHKKNGQRHDAQTPGHLPETVAGIPRGFVASAALASFILMATISVVVAEAARRNDRALEQRIVQLEASCAAVAP